ncbi:hypothetical protein TNIN_347371 [Trichonephila inaurata madagascariensis]|uniref:Uncharacterized protein n=1 Tax=Trichonephila inaurata madagascariensis TaxID=2747483 RepID=A0A8X6M8F5_9ARAC|nr:hypothetical protein TNIN_347371 [Trichonephila inaurata madagascariensis]
MSDTKISEDLYSGCCGHDILQYNKLSNRSDDSAQEPTIDTSKGTRAKEDDHSQLKCHDLECQKFLRTLVLILCGQDSVQEPAVDTDLGVVLASTSCVSLLQMNLSLKAMNAIWASKHTSMKELS